MIPALEYRRSRVRYAAARGTAPVGRLTRSATSLAMSVAPLRLIQVPEPRPPGEHWTRVRPLLSGICGSDLALLTGQVSPYLSALVSTPFVPGHEIFGELIDDFDGLPAGTRVVIDPVLSCRTRGVPLCHECASDRPNRCDHVVLGDLPAGLQTGFCAVTGGGWSQMLVVHRHQLYPVPDSLHPERAVLVEPLACAVHAVRRADVTKDTVAVVIGGGALGLFTVLALRRLTPAAVVIVVTKHSRQQRRAVELGATEAVEPARAVRSVRRVTGGLLERPVLGREYLLGGADVAFVCVGASSGIDTATRLLRAGGQVVLSGLPAGRADLTPVWYRELAVVGTYASASYGAGGDGEGPGSSRQDDFQTAIRLAAAAPLDGYVDGRYRLDDWRNALAHALAAGRSGSVRIVFAPRQG
jgi:threonine dehydrogenase-like Zn-dependent dehydrogenase